MAHLYTQETRKDPLKRYELKWYSIKRLYKKGYSERNIQLLFKFIDWLMKLPEDLKQQLTTRIISYEEENKMPYVTSVEEFFLNKAMEKGMEEGREEGMEKGMEEGILQKAQQNVIQVLKIRFRDPSQETFEELLTMVKQINKEATLDSLFEKALTVDSITAFKANLETYLEDKSIEDTQDKTPNTDEQTTDTSETP